MYSNQELIELVDILRSEGTETEWLEFKSNHVSNQDIGEYISALSNGAALWGRPYAYLIFGVNNRLVEPKIGFNFYEVNYAALKKLVLVEIRAASKQPTSFAGKEYIRIGSYRQDLRKYPETERKLWNELNHVLWEEMVSPVQNLHFKNMQTIADSKDIDFSPEKYATLHMVDENGKFTNLAYLLSDENPHIIKFAVYRNKMYDFAVKKEFSGGWLYVLDQVLDYVNLFNDTSARVIGSDATRTEVKSYPDPSIREAVVNAFAHFDPSFPSDIKIEFFPDKVVIGSPGSLYRTTMKAVLSGRQSFRNPNLVHVLNKFDYIENYATGLQKILSAYSKYPAQPILEPMDNFFVVTLPNVKIGTKDEKYFDDINGTVNGTNGTVNGTVKQIYELIKKQSDITIDELVENSHKARRTVARALNELKEKGYIERVGSDKKGFWKVLK